MASYYPFKIPQCEHIMDTGFRCGSPALRNKPFCYHHSDVHAMRAKVGTKGYRFRPLETSKSVTMQVAEISQAAHDGAISLQLARLLLYGLQIGAPYVSRSRGYSGDVETEITPAMEEIRTAGDREIGKAEEIGPSDHLDIGTSEERVTTPEPKDPITVDATANAPTLPNHEPIIDNQSPANDPVVTDNVTTEGEDQTVSFDEEEMRRSIFHPDAAKVRAYWTQHLPPEVLDLRGPDNQPVYTPPEWLPLTEEQLEYLRDRLGPNDKRLASPEERENHERMTLHSTHGHVKPPQPEEILKSYETLWNGEKMWNDLRKQIKKDPKKAAKMLMKQVG